MPQDPRDRGPRPPQPSQPQTPPGSEAAMDPRPDYGEATYRGSGRLAGKAAVVTGGDSGIGRAVALAFAREGADVLISYLSEEEDAEETARVVEAAGRKCVRVAGDIGGEGHCRAVIDRAVKWGVANDAVLGAYAAQVGYAVATVNCSPTGFCVGNASQYGNAFVPGSSAFVIELQTGVAGALTPQGVINHATAFFKAALVA